MVIEVENVGLEMGHCVLPPSGPEDSTIQCVTGPNCNADNCDNGLNSNKPPDPQGGNILMDTAEVEAVFLSRDAESQPAAQQDGAPSGGQLRV